MSFNRKVINRSSSFKEPVVKEQLEEKKETGSETTNENEDNNNNQIKIEEENEDEEGVLKYFLTVIGRFRI